MIDNHTPTEREAIADPVAADMTPPSLASRFLTSPGRRMILSRYLCSKGLKGERTARRQFRSEVFNYLHDEVRRDFATRWTAAGQAGLVRKVKLNSRIMNAVVKILVVTGQVVRDTPRRRERYH